MSKEINLEDYIKENLPNASITSDSYGYHIYAGNFYAYAEQKRSGDMVVENMKIKRFFKEVEITENDFGDGKYKEIEELIINKVEKCRQREDSIKEINRRKFIRTAIGGKN